MVKRQCFWVKLLCQIFAEYTTPLIENPSNSDEICDDLSIYQHYAHSLSLSLRPYALYCLNIEANTHHFVTKKAQSYNHAHYRKLKD